MRKNTLNSIISLVLVIFLLIPNIATSAVELNGNLRVNEHDVVNSSNELDPLVDETIKLEDEITEEHGDTLEKTEFEAAEEESQIEKSDKNEEAVIENQVEEAEVVEEVVADETENVIEEETVNNDVDKTEENSKLRSTDKYESVKRPQTYSRGVTIDPQEYEREEVRGRLEAISELEYLVPKTEENYEIAMAYSDGSYSYVESAETIDEAINKLRTMPLAASADEVLPAIINNNGQVVYSTNSMLRILSANGSLINLYSDSSLTNAFTYINQNFIDDAPVIEDTGKAVKVEVAGYTGWIDKKTSSEVVPINQVKNPSYYMSEGGVLKHFISYDLRSTSNKGYTLTIGKAPSYLKNGVKYISYDGNYFYDGSNISVALNNIVSDLKNGNHNNAVNASNPHYLYFNYLPFRSKTSYSAAELDNFINNNTDPTSKLRGIGQSLIDAQNTYGVNALLTLGVAINESGWGMSSIAQSKNNIFGLKAYDASPGESAESFKTPGDSILDFAKNYISRGYADPADWRYQGGFLGNKHKGANVKYASDPFWGEKAAQYAHKIDFYLSSSDLSKLRDQDAYQLAIFKGDNQVKNSSGQLLYNITSNLREYAGYHDTPLILISRDPVNKNGVACYEMYPERNTPINNGGEANKFSGNYDWNDKAYVKTGGVQLVNSRNIETNNPEFKNQWKQGNDGKWYYYDGNGNLYKGWLNKDGKWYYLKSSGERASGWIEVGGHNYYFNSEGVMQTGWVNIGSKWYYLESSGAMAKGWRQLSGYWYYMDNSGVMTTGWRFVDGYWYYFDASGPMARGWRQVDGYWYYLENSGVMAKGWRQLNGYWYYLENSGVMSKGWRQISGQWYYFDASGPMAKGWRQVNGNWYYLQSSGVMATNTTIDGWVIDASGVGRPK